MLGQSRSTHRHELLSGATSRHSPTTSLGWPPGSADTVTGGSPRCSGVADGW